MTSTASKGMMILALSLIAALPLASCQRAEKPAAQAADAQSGETPDGEARAREAGSPLLGKPAPALILKTIDGQTIDLSRFYGKRPVYLKFWATWCIPCRQQMPKFEHIFETQGDRIEVIAVNTGFGDDEAHVRAFRKAYGLKMPIVIDDGRLAAALNLRVTPQHVVIGRDGRIAYMGNLDDNALDTALHHAQETPASPVTGTLAAPMPPALQVGDRVGSLSATGTTGAAIPLVSLRHRPRALLFFSSWCESYLATSRPEVAKACRTARETADRLSTNEAVEWLGIAGGPWSTKLRDLVDYQTETHPNIPLALDPTGALFRSFGVRQIPTVILIDADGRIRGAVPPGGDIEKAVAAFE